MNIRRRLAAGLLLLPLAFVSAACVGVTRPQGWASPAIDGSSAFILEDKDRLTALELTDSNTANVRWSFPNDDRSNQEDVDVEAIYARPIVDGDTLYVVGYSGDLFAVNASTGDLIRQQDIGGPVVGDIVLDDGQLIMATGDGTLLVVSAEDFSVVEGWDRAGIPFDDGIWAAPAVSSQFIYVASMSGELVAVDRADGSVEWTHNHDGAIPTLALLDEGHLFASSLSGEVLILDPADGEVLHTFEAEDWVWNTPAFADGIAYFGDFAGNVYALDITTGTLKWSAPYDGGSKVKAGPVIIDDVLVLADRQPVVHFIRLSDGVGLNKVPLPVDVGTVRSDLVVREGRALVLTTDGHLFAADPGAAPGRVDEITYGGGQ
ncbi:MAG: PQQ-binding-like beta-propeller repeat protein [Dehalococcoidia bacterium]